MFNHFKENKILFPGQQPDEKIVLILRHHWVVLVQKLLVWFLFLGIYLTADYLVNNLYIDSIEQGFVSLFNVVKIIYLMFVLLGLLIIWIIWYLNVHIVTNQRIVDIHQPNLLTHTISELYLGTVQDVTAEVHGLLENVFDYGDVHVQTAGETARFKFEKVPNPTRVNKVILDLYEQLPEKDRRKV